MDKFLQILLQTAMRFYARKAVYTFDSQVKKALNYSKFNVTCDTCEHVNNYSDYSIFFDTFKFNCNKCRCYFRQ